MSNKGKKFAAAMAAVQLYLEEEEAALAQAQAENGVIPATAAENIKANATYENLDLELMDEIYRKVGHGFVPFVKVFVKA